MTNKAPLIYLTGDKPETLSFTQKDDIIVGERVFWGDLIRYGGDSR
jgi:hypothetical protein